MHHIDHAARTMRDPRFFQFIRHHAACDAALAALLAAIFTETHPWL